MGVGSCFSQDDRGAYGLRDDARKWFGREVVTSVVCYGALPVGMSVAWVYENRGAALSKVVGAIRGAHVPVCPG